MIRTVASADGTPISYSRIGNGPALVVVPGNNRMAHDYTKLAEILADRFTVLVIDRRGRGESGAQGPDYSITKEVEDVRAVAAQEGARLLFGHSYGGLIALQAARADRLWDKVAVWDPGVSLNGSFDLSFLPTFERLLARGRRARAMATFLGGTSLNPISAAPRPVLIALSALMLGGKSGREMRGMMPTTPPEIREIGRLDSDGAEYAEISASVFLLGAGKSPDYLTGVLGPLATIIPRAKVEIVPDTDHNAPDLNAPTLVGQRLADFFGGA